MQKSAFSCQRNDMTIRGYIFGQLQNQHEVVILSHGLLANQQTVEEYAKVLANEGYITVTFDFNGGGLHSKSDGNTDDMTVLTEKADLMAVIEAVFTNLHPRSISLMGCSQGGFVSALVANELGEQIIHKLILFYPALCIPDDARSGHMMFYKFDPNNVPNLLGRFPMKLGGDYARTVMDMNPYEEIKDYSGPVLLVHGTNDKIVNIRYARNATSCFQNCEYHEIEGGGHGFNKEHDRIAIKYLQEFMRL